MWLDCRDLTISDEPLDEANVRKRCEISQQLRSLVFALASSGKFGARKNLSERTRPASTADIELCPRGANWAPGDRSRARVCPAMTRRRYSAAQGKSRSRRAGSRRLDRPAVTSTSRRFARRPDLSGAGRRRLTAVRATVRVQGGRPVRSWQDPRSSRRAPFPTVRFLITIRTLILRRLRFP